MALEFEAPDDCKGPKEMNMKTIAMGIVVAGMATVFSYGTPAVEAPPPDTSQTATPPTPQQDPGAAVKAVQAALSHEKLSSEISVASHASTVVLTGKVASDAEAARVQTVAEKAAGGLHVSSRLEVPEPSTPPVVPAAVQLVRDVEAALRNDPRTADLGISVSIDEQQTIGLHGLVPSSAASATAQNVASRTRGVKKVANHLETPQR